MKIVILGPAHPYRGGIAAFNERLAKEFISEGHEVELITFTLQYPSFLFPGKTQFSEDPAPADLRITRMMNSVGPWSWLKTGRHIRKLHADLVVVPFWHSYMAPCLGTISRLCETRVVGLVHNLIPHEHKPGDRLFAKYFCSGADGFTTLSKSVLEDVSAFAPGKKAVFSPHPVYDNFGEPVSRTEACAYLNLPTDGKILLSFGLIRDYKGLDWLIEAYAAMKDRSNVHLVVAGEFYSDGTKYHDLAKSLGVDDEIIWRTKFVPDSEVKYFFGAADIIVQPYKSATQSGVTQIAYHFEKPMLVTRVGGLPEIVPDGKVGYVVEPVPEAITEGLERFLSETPDFSDGLAAEKAKYSWHTFAAAVLSV